MCGIKISPEIQISYLDGEETYLMSEEKSDFKGCRTVPVLGEKNLFEGQRFVQRCPGLLPSCGLKRFVEREIVIKELDAGLWALLSPPVPSLFSLGWSSSLRSVSGSGKMFDLWLQPACTAACSQPAQI